MKRGIVLLLLLLTMLFWAVNFHVVKIAMEFYTPVGVAAVRFFFAVIALLVILYFQFGKQIFRWNFSAKDYGYMFLASFFGIFLTIYFFNLGLKSTSAVNGSLIIATSPALTAIFSYIFQKKKLKTLQQAAILTSFLGVVIILTKGQLHTLLQLQFEIGDIYILLMAIVFSLSQIIVNKYLPHINAMVMTTITSIMSLVLFALISFPELVERPVPSDISFWGSILFMGILGTGIAYSAFYYCIVQLGATTSSLYMNLIPFFTVILAFPFGEKIYGVQLLGGVIIIIGLLIFGYSKKKNAQ
ncbi:DMT family transporter [Spongiimicrobium salis]|uniref:DMT family transporter n=1 Tax=Spongiimicrobium salis TaxID=1667022 RepID=UPI00374D28EE